MLGKQRFQHVFLVQTATIIYELTHFAQNKQENSQNVHSCQKIPTKLLETGNYASLAAECYFGFRYGDTITISIHSHCKFLLVKKFSKHYLQLSFHIFKQGNSFLTKYKKFSICYVMKFLINGTFLRGAAPQRMARQI